MDLQASSRIPVTPAYISYGDPVTDPPSALGVVTFDVVLSEEHQRSARVFSHPVENGIEITDQVIPDRDILTLEVFVSNSPINSPDAKRLGLTLDLPQPGQVTAAGGPSALAGGTSALLAQAAVALGLIGGFPTQETVLVDQFPGETDYVRETWQTLTALRDSAALVVVCTPSATYESMAIQSLKMHRDSSTGTGARLTIELKAVDVVSTTKTDAPIIPPAYLDAGPNVSKGEQQPTQAPPAVQGVALKWALASGANVPPPAAGFPAPPNP